MLFSAWKACFDKVCRKLKQNRRWSIVFMEYIELSYFCSMKQKPCLVCLTGRPCVTGELQRPTGFSQTVPYPVCVEMSCVDGVYRMNGYTITDDKNLSLDFHLILNILLPLMNNFNKTEAAIFPYRLCFLRAFLFTCLI